MSLSKKLALRYIRAKFKLLSALSKRKAAIKAFQLFCTPQSRNIKALPPIFEKAEPIHFRYHSFTVYGYRWNHPAEKKAMILHGFESSVINFDRYVKPLLKKGYEVLAIDAPAHGRSTGKTINVLLYKEFIETIFTKYGPIDAFIAHSLGGLSLSLALENMKHTSNTKAVLIAPATETTSAIDMYFHLLQLDGEVRKEFDKVILETGGHQPKWFSAARAAKHIKAQVLWVHDKDDDITPLRDVQPVMDAHYPNYRFLITEGLGHRRIYRDNDVVQAVADFL